MSCMSATTAIHPDVESVLFTQEQLAQTVAQMGAQITKDYAGEELLLISILRGSVVFTADLLRAIDIPCQVDFMAVSSYGNAAQSSGIVRILKDLDTDIAGKHVLIVEDILDSGLTLKYLLRNLATRKPASLEVATLLIKEGKQKAKIESKYVGLSCPDEFVVGYGLDYAEHYRGLPYVGVLRPSVYS